MLEKSAFCGDAVMQQFQNIALDLQELCGCYYRKTFLNSISQRGFIRKRLYVVVHNCSRMTPQECVQRV
jgi:hypothetical protein